MAEQVEEDAGVIIARRDVQAIAFRDLDRFREGDRVRVEIVK